MEGNSTYIDPPEIGSAQDSKRATERKTIAFSFDKSYWSAGPRDEPRYCSQETLYNDVGKELLDHSFDGFNACIFACESCLSLSATNALTSRIDGQTGTRKLIFRVVCTDEGHQDLASRIGMCSPSYSNSHF